MTRIYNRTSEKKRRRQLRKSMPLAEVILWSRLKNKQLLGERFRRQYSVKEFSIDFYCPRRKLAIEVDGDSHFVSRQTMERDEQRQREIERYGVRFLRFTNNDVFTRLDDVLGTIADAILEFRGETDQDAVSGVPEKAESSSPPLTKARSPQAREELKEGLRKESRERRKTEVDPLFNSPLCPYGSLTSRRP